MKHLNQYINEFLVNGHISKAYKYFPETKEELKSIIKERIEKEGKECNLNDIDTSKITDMSSLFYAVHFNGDISDWDTSKVTNMNNMFNMSDFNGDISNWDVSNVKDMSNMFNEANFNGDISNWDVSNVDTFEWMFSGSSFRQNISKWKVKRDAKKIGMFAYMRLHYDTPSWYSTKLSSTIQ